MAKILIVGLLAVAALGAVSAELYCYECSDSPTTSMLDLLPLFGNSRTCSTPLNATRDAKPCVGFDGQEMVCATSRFYSAWNLYPGLNFNIDITNRRCAPKYVDEAQTIEFCDNIKTLAPRLAGNITECFTCTTDNCNH